MLTKPSKQNALQQGVLRGGRKAQTHCQGCSGKEEEARRKGSRLRHAGAVHRAQKSRSLANVKKLREEAATNGTLDAQIAFEEAKNEHERKFVVVF